MTSEGFQIGLFDEQQAVDARLDAWHSKQTFAEELAAFEEAAVKYRGLAPSSAATLSRHLAAMVRKRGESTVREFLSNPPGVVSSLVDPHASHRTRRARHLAVDGVLALDVIDAPIAEIRDAVARLPGRIVPKRALVDVDLGGSLKEVRLRIYPSWEDGERILQAIEKPPLAAEAVRDAALMATLLRTGLRPQWVLDLDWRDVRPLMDSPLEVAVCRHLERGRDFPIAVHESALQRLRRLHELEGRPGEGAVFVGARWPRARLSASRAAEIAKTAVRASGLSSPDLRHFRVGLAHVLLVKGWDRLRVRDAFGYKRLEDLDALVRPLEELLAQMRTAEFLALAPLERAYDNPPRGTAWANEDALDSHAVQGGVLSQ